jgi:hypothetical protein
MNMAANFPSAALLGGYNIPHCALLRFDEDKIGLPNSYAIRWTRN